MPKFIIILIVGLYIWIAVQPLGDAMEAIIDTKMIHYPE